MRIVFVAPEVYPFAKTGGLADVCGTLSLELERLGHDVSIIIPDYRCVKGVMPYSDRARVAVIGKNVRVYFLRHQKFYDRPNIYGDANGDYPDNLERFMFLCHESLALMKELGAPVDIIHCHDWQTSLIPVIVRENYKDDPFFQKTRTVVTIHNCGYQGVFPKDGFSKLGVDGKLFEPKGLEFYGKINLLKGGLVYADRITTVSPQYAREIQTKEWGHGLEGVVKENRSRLEGILNGLNYDYWDPETDVLIDPHYTPEDAKPVKRIHKEKLQNICRLPVFDDIPVFGFVGRLCYQKGLDLLESSIDGLMQRPIQVVFVGVGEEKYQKLLMKFAKKYPQQCGVMIRYDENLAHMVYAGADFFLMPSVYEPCGLAQMISLRYGAIPLVNGVGGLMDTVTDFSSHRNKGNGFVMSEYSVSGLFETVDRALGVFHQKKKFQDLVTYAMGCRWTWATSTRHYIECYERAGEGEHA
jgi:starch synthase